MNRNTFQHPDGIMFDDSTKQLVDNYYAAISKTPDSTSRFSRLREKEENQKAAIKIGEISERILRTKQQQPKDCVVVVEEKEESCEACLGYRFVVDQEGNLKPCRKCGVVERRRIENLKKYSSKSPKSDQQRFENFNPAWEGKENPTLLNALRKAKIFAEEPSGFLSLCGPRGNGKSHLCAAISNKLNATNKPNIFVSMADLVRSLKSLFDKTMTDSEETFEQRLDKYMNVAVLLVDDIGAGNFTNYDEGLLWEIVDYRYRNQMPSVFVSNIDLTDAKIIDPRIISRLNDAEFSTVCRMYAPDYRTYSRLKQP